MHDATHYHLHRPVDVGLDRLKAGPEARLRARARHRSIAAAFDAAFSVNKENTDD
jgi:hypothetical protein